MKSTQPSLALIGLHDFLIFSNRMARAWSVEAGNTCSVSVFFVRVGSQISPRRAKKDSNIPSPGRTRSVKCPTPGTTKTIKSQTPCPAPPPTNKHCWPVYASIWPQTARINKRREYLSLATASTRQCITCYGRDGTIASRPINRENDIEDLVNFKKTQFVLGSPNRTFYFPF